MRSALLSISIIAGYALLRGWPEDWHPIIRVCLAVSALVVAFALWGQAKKPTSTIAEAARTPRPLDYLTVGIAILLVECFFLVFLSLAPTKSEKVALALDESLHPEIYSTESTPDLDQGTSPSSDGGTGTGRITSNWLFSGPGPRTLNKSDKVTPSNRPELYLYPASKGDASRLLTSERFLRNFTLATYRDGSWFPLAAIPHTLRATGKTISFPSKNTGPSVVYEISHPVNPSGQTLAVTIPACTSIQLPSLRETAPATFRLPTSASHKNTYRYQATSSLFQFDQITSPITPGSTPSPEYLALPPTDALREKIQTLASGFGQPSIESLVKLRQVLRSRYQYSLNLSMPEDVDPLDSFLFKTRIGYCTHFATATVMLTRAMGIPSRIAFGWSGGRYFEKPNLFVLRAREAHAWAEIYLEDHGWVIFETTPASRNEGTPSIADSDEPAPFPNLFDDSESIPPELALAPLLKIATWLGLASAVALLVTLFLRRSTAQMTSHTPAQSVLPRPPHYLSAFRSACLAHGNPMPPGRTLRTHLNLINAPSFTAELLTYHYSVHYGDAPPNKATEKKIIGNLKAWEKTLNISDPNKN